MQMLACPPGIKQNEKCDKSLSLHIDFSLLGIFPCVPADPAGFQGRGEGYYEILLRHLAQPWHV